MDRLVKEYSFSATLLRWNIRIGNEGTIFLNRGAKSAMLRNIPANHVLGGILPLSFSGKGDLFLPFFQLLINA